MNRRMESFLDSLHDLTQRQGDKETRGQGDKASSRLLPLVPVFLCPLVSSLPEAQ
jgi:hypothetical protein